jgi:hypothetical protein
MTNERELHAQVEWLIKLAKITIERQDSMDSLLNSIHDRMLFSPPLAHADLYFESIEDDMEELHVQVNSVISGLNRIRAGSESTPPTERKQSQPPQFKNQDWNPNL